MSRLFKHYCLTELIVSKTPRSVYLAHDSSNVSQKVILKIFDTQCLALDPQSESFLQRLECIRQLRHAYIVPILDLGIEEGQLYVVHEYMSNNSLRHYLDRVSPEHLNLQEALTIISQVGQALCYAHEHDLLHGNIKPENIFFNEKSEALLTDFSLTSFIDVTKLDQKSDLHTICYMAPEQFIGSISEKSDQYALSCLAYYLMTGHVPFTAYNFSLLWLQHSTEEPIAPSKLVPHLPKSIEKALLKAMAKDPSERYADVSTFLADLEAMWISPTSVFTHPHIIPSSNSSVPFPFTLTQLVENMENRVPLTQLLEQTESQTPPTLHKSWESCQSEFNTSLSPLTPTGDDQTEQIPILRQPRDRKRSIPAWLLLVLSGLIILMVVTPQIFLPFHSSEPIRHVKASPTILTGTHATNMITYAIPTPQPTPSPTLEISPSPMTLPTPHPLQVSLSGSYAEQTSEVYNLTTEGTLDWIHWGLHAPTDVDRKSSVQPQISSFSLIGDNSTVQRDGHYSNAYIWSDGTPVASVGQVPSGVYVTGVNNGFAIGVAASSTPRTLRVYIGDNLAQGQLTASLASKTYTDASLNMIHDPYNVEDNGIYTLVFSSSAPNQTLTVTYTALQTNGSNGYVMLQSATLQ